MDRYLPILFTLAVSLWSVQPAGAESRKVCNDFDGDGKTDVAIYYPSSGLWQVLLSGSRTITNVTVGGGNYLPAPGDYDGDGKTDFVVFDSTTATWWGKFSAGGEGMGTFGQPGTWPVPADYDGDRVTDLGVYDPLTGIWSVCSLSKGWSGSIQWGYLGDFRDWDNPQTYTILPMPFDYNQDGVDDPGYYYRGWSMDDSGWSILYIGIGQTNYIWGSSGSLPAPGKYQVAADAAHYYAYGLGVYKIVNRDEPVKSAEWNIPNRDPFYMGVYGETLPVSAGDYDGNGFDDNAVYNYVTGQWTIIFNTGNGDVIGREQANGFFGGPAAMPANIYSTIYRLAGYSPKPW